MCRGGRLHPALRCDGEQGVSWGLPPPCALLLSYTRSLQHVPKGRWVRLGTGTGTKGAERLVREGWCERAELLAAGLAWVGATSLAAAPGCLFPSTLNAGAAPWWWAGAAAPFPQHGLLQEAQSRRLHILPLLRALRILAQGLRV